MISRQLRKQMLADGDQSVSFAELFFDIVFVFAVTQVVEILHHGFDWLHVGRAILVFWLVWWAWTQFTWALNAANTKHKHVLFWIIMATAVGFFMAIGVPVAITDQGWWFAISYVAVRGIGLLIYIWVSMEDPDLKQAVRSFASLSLLGLAAVIAGGLIGGEWRYILWGLTILLDVIAATVGGRRDGWNIHPGHFTERHGLFMIIALGENLIVAAAGVSHGAITRDLVLLCLVSVGITCSLWWLYFINAREKLEHALEQAKGFRQSMLARDAFSLIHFPMIVGLIFYAYSIKESLYDPDHALDLTGRLALGLGILLFSGSMVLAVKRATGKWIMHRVIATLVLSAMIIGIGGLPCLGSLALAFGGLLVLCIWDDILHRQYVRNL